MLNDTEHKSAYIEAKMKQFKLVDMRTQYRDIIQKAEQESLGYMDFLLRLLELEDSGKTSRRTEKLLVKAGFDSAYSLDDIDYSFNPPFDKDKIDEFGKLSYIKMDKERESLFFQIIRQRYEKSSLIITTNLPMGRWDEVFTGQLAATAILDRLLHHCHVLSITGDSYRVKGSKISVKKQKGTEK